MKRKAEADVEKFKLRRSPRVRQSEYHCVDVRLNEERDAAVVALSLLAGEPEAVPSRPHKDGPLDWTEVMGAISLDEQFEVLGTRCRFDVVPATDGVPAQLVIIAVRPLPRPPKEADPISTPSRPSLNEPHYLARMRDAARVVPRLDTVGYFTSSGGSISPGGLYVWFASVREMRRHIIEVEPALALGAFTHAAVDSYRDEFDKISARLRRCMKDVDSSSLSPSLGRRLTSILEDTQIRWMGTFGSLCDGSSAWARRARARFRQTTARRHPARETDAARTARLEAPFDEDEDESGFAHFIRAFEL